MLGKGPCVTLTSVESRGRPFFKPFDRFRFHLKRERVVFCWLPRVHGIIGSLLVSCHLKEHKGHLNLRGETTVRTHPLPLLNWLRFIKSCYTNTVIHQGGTEKSECLESSGWSSPSNLNIKICKLYRLFQTRLFYVYKSYTLNISRLRIPSNFLDLYFSPK